MDFEQMIQELVWRTGKSREEIFERVKRKQEELGGLLPEEEILRIVKRELEDEMRRVQIGSLMPQMGGINVIARVERLYDPRRGPGGCTVRMILRDATGSIKAIVFDREEKFISQIESGQVKKGDVLEVRNAYVMQDAVGNLELRIALPRSSIEVVPPTDPRARGLPLPEERRFKIAELKPELGEVDVVGRVLYTGRIRPIERFAGQRGRVGTFILGDETGKIRVVLWDEKAELVRGLKRGDLVLLENAIVRERDGVLELHVRLGRVVMNPQVESPPPQVTGPVKIADLDRDIEVDLVAVIRGIRGPFDFRRDDGSPGRVLTLLLSDDTGTIRASLWDEDATRAIQVLKEGDVVRVKAARTRLNTQTDKLELVVDSFDQLEVNPPGVQVPQPRVKRVKIAELEPDSDMLEVVGRVLEEPEVRYVREKKVVSLVLADDTGQVMASIWDPHAERCSQLRPGQILRLVNAYTSTFRDRIELRLGALGELQVDPPGVDLPPLEALKMAFGEPALKTVPIEELQPGMRACIRGTIVDVRSTRPVFDVCPECGRSLGTVDHSPYCRECGKVVTPQHKAKLDLVLDDGTATIRGVFFGRVAEQVMGMDADRICEHLQQKTPVVFFRELKLEGRELKLVGVARQDRFFPDQLEFRVERVFTPDYKKEAEELLQEVKSIGGA